MKEYDKCPVCGRAYYIAENEEGDIEGDDPCTLDRDDTSELYGVRGDDMCIHCWLENHDV